MQRPKVFPQRHEEKIAEANSPEASVFHNGIKTCVLEAFPGTSALWIGIGTTCTWGKKLYACGETNDSGKFFSRKTAASSSASALSSRCNCNV